MPLNINDTDPVPLRLYNVGAPMERIAIDVLGPLPVTERGSKYLLVAIDYFTKWPEAFAIATTVAKVLWKSFSVDLECL